MLAHHFRQPLRSRLLRRSAAVGIVLISAVLIGLFVGRLAGGAIQIGGGANGTQNGAMTAPDDLYPVYISIPEGPPRIDAGLLDELGRPVTVSCASCHANFEPNLSIRAAAELTEFHHGLHYDHGSLTCVSCHNPNNYNTLRLADGSALAYENVMTLCGQCHAPQHRDYLRGAHGGMTGYWDRSRGPQHRKSCIDCHDPHSPKFPHMIPTFKPHDRFLEPPHGGH